MEALRPEVRTCVIDLPECALESARRERLVGWDIETSGLNWKTDCIGTCQIFVPGQEVFVVQLNGAAATPRNLGLLLTDKDVRKVFHHAIFDLRFMIHQWSIKPQNVACTKIASKILTPSEEDHTLKSTLQRYLRTSIDKELGNSDWLRSRLSYEQVHYAAEDVMYLPTLYSRFRQLLQAEGRWQLAEACFSYLPVRASLDILGAGDVFKY